ncbi:MAG: ATP-dependent helicase [Saprospiraceae bacterium]
MSTKIQLCDTRKELLKTKGHLLVQGGPGSGKTTIAIIKAQHVLEAGNLKAFQKILFLSFARATIARVEEHAKSILDKQIQNSIEVNTYHGFAWSIIKSYGYLLSGRRNFKILTPPQEATKLANFAKKAKTNELQRLFYDEGLLAFDLFAPITAELLKRSNRIATLISDCYPIIIVDEFQDTNIDEWNIIRTLGKKSTIIALADSEQRIYEFRGADPQRIKQFEEQFSPSEFHFKGQNNRSGGTDIVQFGNDLLRGRLHLDSYKDVDVFAYNSFQKPQFVDVKYAALNAIKRLNKTNQNGDWSIAILVRTRQLMLQVSQALTSTTSKTKPLQHEILVDPTGPALSAVLIANLLDEVDDEHIRINILIQDLTNYLRGRNGGTPNKANVDMANALEKYIHSGKVVGSKRQHVIETALNIASKREALVLSGDPLEDWVDVRDLIGSSNNEIWKLLASDAQYIRLLNKGKILREELSSLWRQNGYYKGAGPLVNRALEREYFEAPRLKWQGLFVMTLHKSKGKEFDEVIILDGAFNGRLFANPNDKDDTTKSSYLLRVGVTRAKKRVTILTPSQNPCHLFSNRRN